MSIALRSGITVIGAAVMLAITSPRLAGLAMIGIPLIVLPIALSGRRVRGAARESQDRVADATARAGETFNAMHTVQSYAREPFERDRFGAAVLSSLAAARKRIRMQSLLTAGVIVLVFGAITAVLRVGAQDVVAGTMSAGTLGQFLLYAVLGAGSVGGLAEVWSVVQRAGGGMERINELLDEQSQLPVSAHPRPLPSQLASSANRVVDFNYPTRPDSAG